jgi:predicted O-methyltransferase YrrM
VPSAQYAVMQSLWGDNDPYRGFPARRYRPDMQGWNSDHPYLRSTIEEVRPRIVIELGVWKGGSTMFMAETMRGLGLDAVVISIDTWLGAWDHWNDEARRGDLMFAHGYPTLFYTFLTNVIERGLSDYVVPLPLDSQNAYFVLRHRKVSAQIVHIDAGHDYEAVAGDLRRWWELLEPGGVLIADDYDAAGRWWPEVRKAVDDFLRVTPHENFMAENYKCRVTKSAAPAVIGYQS